MKKSLNILFLVILAACIAPSDKRRDLADIDNSGTTVSSGDLTVLPQVSNFVSINSTEYTQTFEVPADFTDSFLIRGNEIIQYLNNVDFLTAQYCLALPYNQGSKTLLILNALPLKYLNYVTNKTEYYFKVFPGSTSQNQICQHADLINTINTDLGTSYTLSDAAWSLLQVCPNCTSAINSSGFKLYLSLTKKVNLNINQFNLRLKPATGSSSGSSAPSCLVSETCTNLGYNCCLNNQCVKDAAIKNGVDQSTNDFQTAFLDVQTTPGNFRNYPEYYYICPIGSGGSSGGGTTPSPEALAAETQKTLRDLYQCLNPAEDTDMSVCTSKISAASALIGSTGYTFKVPNDDLTMVSLNGAIDPQNITEIDYSGSILYQQNTTALSATHGSFDLATQNDILTQGQEVTITAPLPTSAELDILRIRYSVLGTCKPVSANISKCTKIYFQGQVNSPARSTDHLTSQIFALPSFANTSYNMIVKVGDVVLPQDATTWSVSGSNIIFTKNITANQKVEITFFVTTDADKVVSSIKAAQTELNSLCGFDEATLEPVINPQTGLIEKYNCIAKTTGSIDPPFQGTIYLDAKTVPHKFYDDQGAYWTSSKIAKAGDQEGTAFEYINNNILRPNNQDNDIGFNEIYGSFKKGANPPIPTQVITIKKNQIYDLYTDSGSFSTCVNCGSDYYSSLQRVFPEVFNTKGGGYEPDLVQTSRTNSFSKYRSDDLLFGRACFVPATMIPWTHAGKGDINLQRRERQNAQHFLFANGYNKDWYGFDYGSVIGSFDGVTWFSVGSARRITAKSNKLYLAINAYFGDITVSNTYRVQVQESLGLPNVGPDADHDTETDGAQCQQNHFCNSDRDCLSQLGYDYVCENVTGIKTPWPTMDSQGQEQTGSTLKTIATLVGGTNGQNKRCVYRGRGAPCERGDIYNLTSTYAGTTRPALNSCSSNHYCAPLTQNSFNLKISRYGADPRNQNSSSYIPTDSDLVGLNARILGRPLSLIGLNTAPGNVQSQLGQAQVANICVPGRNPQNTLGNISNLNQQVPFNRTLMTDFMGNIGPTLMSGSVPQHPDYYLACPTLDKNGDLLTKENPIGQYAKLQVLSPTQNIATNLLTHTDFDGLDLLNDTNRDRIGVDRNSCLRAPGASCFTDFDCSGNTWMTNKIRNLSNFLNLNTPEQEFWKTEMMCGNPTQKYTDQALTINAEYDASENRCCRERGLEFANYSQVHEGSSFTSSNSPSNPLTPGVNLYYLSDQRYTLHQVASEKIMNDNDYQTLRVPAANPGTVFTINDLLGQYNTLHEINSRMCCTGNWVRQFSSENGGGSTWHYSKTQDVPRKIFRHINWLNNQNGTPFECEVQNYPDPTQCEIINISEGSSLEKQSLDWLGRLELAGVPQLTINPNRILAAVDDDQLTLAGRPLGFNDSDDQLLLPYGSGTIDATKDTVYSNDGVDDYYSLNDENDFGSKLKKVFSDKQFNCCEPTGKNLTAGTTSAQCCTGLAANNNQGQRRCCLPDFTDISVYLNRYISSEGAGLPDSSYDSETGYIKNPEVVKQIAIDRGLCCSGRVALGVAIMNLQAPIFDGAGNAVTGGLNQSAFTRRFVSGEANDKFEAFNNSPSTGNIGNIYDKGVRWNNHVYCVDKDYQDPYP